ncbi:MAG: hypothetical protein O3B09_03305, partial [Proteobacteria bacterium]|nr:hypothetical protein [Pseudomonadota bacterium]
KEIQKYQQEISDDISIDQTSWLTCSILSGMVAHDKNVHSDDQIVSISSINHVDDLKGKKYISLIYNGKVFIYPTSKVLKKDGSLDSERLNILINEINNKGNLTTEIVFSLKGIRRAYEISNLPEDAKERIKVIEDLKSIDGKIELEIESDILDKIYRKILSADNAFCHNFSLSIWSLLQKLDLYYKLFISYKEDGQLTEVGKDTKEVVEKALSFVSNALEFDDYKAFHVVKAISENIDAYPSRSKQYLPLLEAFIHQAESQTVEQIEINAQYLKEIIEFHKEFGNNAAINDAVTKLLLGSPHLPLKTLHSFCLEKGVLKRHLKDLWRYREDRNLQSKKLEEIKSWIASFADRFDRDPHGNRDEQMAMQFDVSKKDLASHIQTLIGDRGWMYNPEFCLSVVDSKKHEYAQLSKEELAEKIESYKQKLKDTEPQYKFHANLEVLALLRESYFRSTGRFPYTTQLLPLLYFITNGDTKIGGIDQKIMAEISTGQGKSLITAMYVAFQAINGKASHTTSATDALSKRDFHENQAFYNYLGLQSHYIDHNGVNGGDELYQAGRIYHSTPSNFYFYLSKEQLKDAALPIPIGDVAWLSDETDTALDNKTLWRLANGGGQDNPLKELYVITNEFYEKHKDRINEIAKEEQAGQVNQADIDRKRNELIASLVGEFKAILENNFNDLYYKFLNDSCLGDQDLLEDKVKMLLASARYAAGLKQDKHYIVEQISVNGKLYNVARIMKASGEPDRSSTWGDGVQQLLHARLEKEAGLGRFTCDRENKALTMGTTKQLMQYCGNFVGITGTMGQEADLTLLQEQFGINSAIKIHPHQILRRKDMGAVLLSDGVVKKKAGGDPAVPEPEVETGPFNKNQLKKLYNILSGQDKMKSQNPEGIDHNRAQDSAGKKQPMLIICDNLAEAKVLYAKIMAYPSGKYEEGKSIQIITGEEVDAQMEQKLKLAAQSDVITISTPMSGRGTDIKPKHSKGLYTILMSVFNDRETAQVEGRSGRNGAEGKTLSLINADNPKYSKILEARKEKDAEDKKNNEKPSHKDGKWFEELTDNEKLIFLRTELFKHEKENIKKQVAESELVEKIFREYCALRNQIDLSNKDVKTAGDSEDDAGSLLFDLDNIFATFLDDRVAYFLQQYKIDKDQTF